MEATTDHLCGATMEGTVATDTATQTWLDLAICRGSTEIFFAPHAERPQARVKREARARLLCQACPVVFECRRHARLHREYGVWGGESEEDRAGAGYPVPAPIGGRSRRAV